MRKLAASEILCNLDFPLIESKRDTLNPKGQEKRPASNDAGLFCQCGAEERT